MKILRYDHAIFHSQALLRTLILMKLIFAMLVTVCLQQGVAAYGQTITISKRNASISSILKEIRAQTGYDFFFEDSSIDGSKKIDIRIKNGSIEEVLTSCFKDEAISYTISGNAIVIRERSNVLPVEAIAVQRTLNGTVTDAEGNVLAGVSVYVKGTAEGTTTNSAGIFQIEVDAGDVLVLSYLGFTTQELVVDNRQSIDVVMEGVVSDLDEVMVVGYGTQRKSDITGAISSIKADELPLVASTSIEQMLAGKAAGMQVRANDAQPGGSVEVLVRGAASTGAGNDPLYIIDGFPVSGGTDPNTSTRYSIGSRSPLNSLNPNDIESIEILKDASATAIYGARAANGVILITTKSGQRGVAKVDYDVRASFQDVLKPWDMLNASEWMQARADYLHERWLADNKIGVYGDTDPSTVTPFSPPYTQAEIAAAGVGTNWVDEVTRKGHIQDHNLSINGGSENTNYLISLNYFDHKGIVRNNDFNRITGRINLTQQIKSWLSAGVRATGSKIGYLNPAIGTGIAENTGVLESALKFTPTLPVRDASGDYSYVPNAAAFPNPVSLLEISNKSAQDRLFVQTFAEAEPVTGLKIRAQFGFDRQEGVNNIYLPKSTLYGDAVGGQANINQSNRFDKLFNTTVSYKRAIGSAHRIDALVGYEWQSMGSNGFNLGNNRFATDAFLTNSIGAGESERPTVGSYRNVNELASYFGRINYNFDDRYLLTVTMRADGSSRFGEGNRFGYFPSGALAWRIDQERFMADVSWISNAKIRLSIGQTGNSNISGAYAFYSFGSDYLFGNSISKGTYLSSYANADLRWETTTEYNLGIDLGFANNRINVTTELFSKEISDLLGQRQLKTYLPLDNVAANLGKTSSKGFEVTINTVNTTGAFQWSSDVTLSAYRDRWKERSPDVVLRSYQSATDPIRVHWGYVLDGLVQPGEEIPYMPGAHAGIQKVKDINGYDENNRLTGEPDGILNDADVVKIANADPSLIFGFGNTFRYQRFDLNIHLYGMTGILHQNRTMGYIREMPNIDRGWNMPDMADLFWSSDNQGAAYPNINVVNPFPGGSQHLLQKADFIRVRNITLGYTLPSTPVISKWLSKARIYADAANPFVFTSFKGIDPEFSGIYPPAKSFSLGLHIQF